MVVSQKIIATVVLLTSLLCGTMGKSATIHVPAGQPTIQAGIDAAADGDTVLVASGVYTGDGNRNISFNGKGVALIAAEGPQVTIIDGQSSAPSDTYRGFYFGNGEDSNTVVQGFTIRNCVASQFSHGGGMWGHGTPPVSPKVIGNIITNCAAGRGGGALFQDGASPTIIGNTIVGNYAYTTVNGGLQTDNGVVINNIIRDNVPTANFSAGPLTMVAYNNIQNGPTEDGNIDSDPLFMDPTNGDFRLTLSSPCIDAGHPDPQYNDPDGTRNDMGALPTTQCTSIEVLTVSPGRHQLAVPPNTNIEVTLDSPLDETSISATSFLAVGRSSGLHVGNITYDGSAQHLILDPISDFALGEEVTVILTSSLESQDGSLCFGGYQWSFRAGNPGGEMFFEVGGTFPVGTWPHTVFAADFNSDSYFDLTTAQRTSQDISVLLNLGDATFGSAALYPINGESRSGIALDVDNDGDMDLASGNTYGSNTVSVFRNDGSGTFGPRQDYATGTQPYAIAGGDFNSDGLLDLATANEVSNDVSILLNQGDGSYGSPQHYPATGVLRSLCTGDFDNDGDLDIAAVGGTPGGSLAVLSNSGNGTFLAPSIYPLGIHPWSVTAADMNGDGYLDVVVVNRDSDDIHVLFNDGDGALQPGISYPSGDGPVSVAVADFDADADLDLVVTNDFSCSVILYANDGEGALSLVIELSGYDRAYSSFPADYDNDGDIDIAVVNLGAHSVSILLNAGCNSGGSVEGTLLSGSVGLQGVSVDLYDAEGILLQSAATDVSGAYEFAGLPPGDYTTSISTPLGYQAEQESQVVTVKCGTSSADFFLAQLDIVPQQRGRGYWMHEVSALLSGKGNSQETYSSMCDYMELIRIHLNEHGLNPITVFTVSLSSDCTGNLESLRTTISPRPRPSMNDKAKAQLTALLLNMVSGKIAQWETISNDGATLSQAITYCNYLITDADESNDDQAKAIAEGINNGEMLEAGMVDLTTVHILYKAGFDGQLPSDYYLAQNCPNPFNPKTEIAFSLPIASNARLAVYNVVGQRVTILVDGYLEAGVHSVTWDASETANGVYFYRLSTDNHEETRKMILLK